MTVEERRNALVNRLVERENIGERTEAALRTVPRHEFVPPSRTSDAYRDRPLPIGQSQTISAPHMVAVMTDILGLSPGDRVLEIGTGCGYHAAVTAEVVGSEHVYSVEYHEALAERAQSTLAETGYGEVSVRCGDGKQGWEANAPFDVIYLTCAASEFPAPLVEQLRDGGVILGPLGDDVQILTEGRTVDGSLQRESHGRVRFVPLK
ncbi:protein-L-isoaspartate(D-aspartate) O-methyltransferase [Halovenus salina]|uniref:Protein-L-isoaspartate O-methyltransferase n=1 Tax=Halovenus salina TaxID=1510225 RepID=A0ABD5W0Y3_9EURY|nr:protein-L-isoaspartate(D-aspartate) O-methyltransferase [Halovenus salina]